MKKLREEKQNKFEDMRARAKNETRILNNNLPVNLSNANGGFNNIFKSVHSSNKSITYSRSVMSSMGPIKSFLELSDSMLKLRENFDSVILGKKPLHGSGKQIEEDNL